MSVIKSRPTEMTLNSYDTRVDTERASSQIGLTHDNSLVTLDHPPSINNQLANIPSHSTLNTRLSGSAARNLNKLNEIIRSK